MRFSLLFSLIQIRQSLTVFEQRNEKCLENCFCFEHFAWSEALSSKSQKTSRIFSGWGKNTVLILRLTVQELQCVSLCVYIFCVFSESIIGKCLLLCVGAVIKLESCKPQGYIIKKIAFFVCQSKMSLQLLPTRHKVEIFYEDGVEAVEQVVQRCAPSLETFKVKLHEALATLLQLRMPLIIARRLDQMVFNGPCQPNPFYNSSSSLHSDFNNWCGFCA